MATLQQLTQGAQGLYDLRNQPLDARTFDWQTPFKLRGLWTMTPEAINAANRGLRDRAIQLLTTSSLPRGLTGMMQDTRQDQRERGAVILPHGNLGRVIRGQRHEVNFHSRPGVVVVGEVHTHPPSLTISPPSYPEDFRRMDVVLVAESANGRIWQAFWNRYAMILGSLANGWFDSLDPSSVHFQIVFGMR
jgi:hypothetical protein